MQVIGITGGIGTGKSTVLRMLEEKYNAYIVETDKLAHQLMMPGQPAYNRIVEAFSTDILDEDGTIDRKKLGSIVFKNEQSLHMLNEIVHPAVKQYILKDIETKRQEGQVSFYIIEAALLIEDGYKAICDELWYIYTEKEERIKRLLQSRGGTREKWEQVMANQSKEDYYKEHCHRIIENGSSFQATEKRIQDILFLTE